jgi:hypothetical protein
VRTRWKAFLAKAPPIITLLVALSSWPLNFLTYCLARRNLPRLRTLALPATSVTCDNERWTIDLGQPGRQLTLTLDDLAHVEWTVFANNRRGFHNASETWKLLLLQRDGTRSVLISEERAGGEPPPLSPLIDALRERGLLQEPTYRDVSPPPRLMDILFGSLWVMVLVQVLRWSSHRMH